VLLFGQNAVDPLIELFEKKKYEETLSLAKVKRNSARASELASIDLIIACSYCMDSRDARRGKAVLDKITNNYRLSRKQERSVQQIRAVCGTPTAAVRLPELDVVKTVRDMGEVSVRGGSAKSGWEISLDDRYRTIELDTSATSAPPTHAAAFALTEKEEAVDYYQSLYAGTDVQQTLSEYFLIYSLTPVSAADLRPLGERMDYLLQAYAAAYDFDRPDGLITLHVAANNEQINRLSRALYGFELGTDNRGYSDINNRSMLVKIEDLYYQGTLMHELMHILVNYNTTLPPWLSEGFPALFEAASADGMRGIGNWRYHVLKNVLPFQKASGGYKSEYLSPALFEMNWAAFDAEDRSVPGQLTIDRLQMAVNHAAARYFVLYLQEWGKLPDIVAAFDNFHFGHPSFEQYATNTELIEAVTGSSMDDIWAYYIRWLNDLE
jgi:hypothetical protein